ncbi:MAG: potassium transporter TrkA [Opitutaceae bacterium]|nr:potassium transporter TrkA [Opitutaceae bacterium]
MKFFTANVAAFLEKGSSRRNFKLLIRFLLILFGMICLYSFLFHMIMRMEGQEHSPFTGIYWTLTVMSTLGFGDITFYSDLGRLFSTIVLVSGMVFLLMLMPFTLIEFFYTPWVEAQAKTRAPRDLPEDIQGHVIITHLDTVTENLIGKLKLFDFPYILLEKNLDTALRLHDSGFRVIVGDPDHPDTYNRLRLDQAALVAATGTDFANTTVTFTVREHSKTVPILTTANRETAVDIQKLAGSTRVFRLGQLMGQALARRTSAGGAAKQVIGNFDKLIIAEATAAGTPLVGKTLAEAELRNKVGVSVVGVWERGQFGSAGPDTVITRNTVLVMAGSSEQFQKYDEEFSGYNINNNPVVIIGGGRVGRSAGDTLTELGIDFRILETLPERVRRFGEKAIIGDASNIDILKKAGIKDTPAIIITPHDDDVNIYLTIFCRKLRSDVKIISRAVNDRNVSTLHRAGADFVLSYASMGSNIIFNYLKRNDLLMVAEGLNVFNVKLPKELAGKTLIEADVRKKTGCTVIAIQENGDRQINPDPTRPLEKDEEMLLIGNAEAETKWFSLYGKKKKAKV